MTACLAALSMGGGFVAGVILAPLLVALARRAAGLGVAVGQRP